jgi:hypothetical protein
MGGSDRNSCYCNHTRQILRYPEGRRFKSDEALRLWSGDRISVMTLRLNDDRPKRKQPSVETSRLVERDWEIATIAQVLISRVALVTA